jgi:hypothetical protein
MLNLPIYLSFKVHHSCFNVNIKETIRRILISRDRGKVATLSMISVSFDIDVFTAKQAASRRERGGTFPSTSTIIFFE